MTPLCPDCMMPMAKWFIELKNHEGYQAVWACGCLKQDWEKGVSGRMVQFLHEPPPAIGQAVNDLLKDKDQ